MSFRLENGWFVREIPSPVQTGGTSSTVPSTPPSDGEHEILVLNGDISEMRSKDHRTPESTKQTKKVRQKKYCENPIFNDKYLAQQGYYYDFQKSTSSVIVSCENNFLAKNSVKLLCYDLRIFCLSNQFAACSKNY